MNRFMLVVLGLAAITSSAFANEKVDSVKQSLDGSGVKLISWYKKGDTEFADTDNKYFSSTIAINENKGMANIRAYGLTFAYMGSTICKQLAMLVPHEESQCSWDGGCSETEDSKIINSVIYRDSPVGQKNKAELSGWTLTFMAESITDFSCSITKGNY